MMMDSRRAKHLTFDLQTADDPIASVDKKFMQPVYGKNYP
jgi:hypothetical protein